VLQDMQLAKVIDATDSYRKQYMIGQSLKMKSNVDSGMRPPTAAATVAPREATTVLSCSWL
jgi:hypothetical protein